MVCFLSTKLTISECPLNYKVLEIPCTRVNECITVIIQFFIYPRKEFFFVVPQCAAKMSSVTMLFFYTNIYLEQWKRTKQ